MTAIVYPASLPGPSAWVAQGPDRRALSSLPGNAVHRPRWRDRIATVEAQWHYSATEMAAWRAWYEDDLLDGQIWFAASAPGVGGFAERVLRYRTSSLRREALGNGVYRVSATLEQRGRGVAPRYFVAFSVDIDLHGVNDAGLSSAVGTTISGLDAAGTYRVSFPSGRTYTAWSAWGFDGDGDAGGLPWACSVAVTDDAAAETGYQTTRYVSAAAAFAAAASFDLTGSTSYGFHLSDPNPGDNRGGLSLTLTRVD
jgi:hypothetical protein